MFPTFYTSYTSHPLNWIFPTPKLCDANYEQMANCSLRKSFLHSSRNSLFSSPTEPVFNYQLIDDAKMSLWHLPHLH